MHTKHIKIISQNFNQYFSSIPNITKSLSLDFSSLKLHSFESYSLEYDSKEGTKRPLDPPKIMILENPILKPNLLSYTHNREKRYGV